MEISQLGKNVQKEMDYKNLTIQSLRKKANVGYATLYDLLHGKKNSLNTKTIEKLAKALDCTPNHLLGIETIEYEVVDIEQTLELILESDDLELDGILITSNEKEELSDFFKTSIELIRKRRKRNI